MPRIPIPDNINPGSIQGDRMAYSSADLGAPGRALQGLGRAVSGLAEEWKANADKMSQYNTNLELEKWSTAQTIGYQQDLDTSAPDGSDFIPKREKNLIDSFTKIRKGITDPELAAKADMVFERIRGTQVVNGMQDTKKKAKSYVLATTGDSVKAATQSFRDPAEYNDYFENVVKPRIDSVISDPLDRRQAYDLFGKQMREQYFKSNPQVALPTVRKSPGKAISGGDRGKQLAFVVHELKGSEGNAGRMLKAATTIEEATAAGISYERPQGWTTNNPAGGHGFQNRLKFARQVLAGEATPEAMQARAYFESQGYTAIQASGMVGNLMQESGTRLNPNAANPKDPGTSIGVGQWNRERKAAMLAFTGQSGDVMIPDGSGLASYEVPQMPTGGIFESMDQSEWVSYVKSGQGAMKDSLDLGIARGAVTREEIDLAPIDDGDKATLLRRWDEKNEDAANLGDFVSRIESGGMVNPKDSKDRKSAGQLLEAVGGGKAISEGDPQAVTAMYDLYDKTGIVPDVAKGAIESMLRSKDPARVTTALSYLEALDARNHRAFQQEFDEGTESLVQQYRDNIAYATPKEAAAKVMEAKDTTTEAIRKERGKEAEKVASKLTIGDVMDKFDPSILPLNEPDLTVAKDAEAQLMLDYRRLYVDAYRQTGDDAQAQKIAANNLTRVWGASAANSGRVMKHPPEALYGPQAMVNGSFDWMAEDVETGLRVRGYVRTVTKPGVVARGVPVAGEPGVEVLPHYLLADSQTLAEQASGKRPSYQVWIMDEDGAYDVVPSRFSFDPESARTRMAPKLEADRQTNIERRKRLDADPGNIDSGTPPGLGGGGNVLDSPFVEQP